MQIIESVEEANAMAEKGTLIGCFLMSSNIYHKCSGISNSKLCLIEKSAATLKYAMDNPDDSEKHHFSFGKAVHTIVLEPENFNQDFAVKPDAFRRNSINYKEWKKDNLDKVEIEEKDLSKFQAIANMVMESSTARKALSGHYEMSFFWTDSETGVLCKCRPDITHSYAGMLVDLKKTADISPDAFAKSIFNFKYHIQGPWYLDGVAQALQQSKIDIDFVKPDKFLFLVVEDKPPFLVATYELEPEFMDEGRKRYRKNLNYYAECLKEDKWPGLSDKVVTLSSKSWMYKD